MKPIRIIRPDVPGDGPPLPHVLNMREILRIAFRHYAPDVEHAFVFFAGEDGELSGYRNVATGLKFFAVLPGQAVARAAILSGARWVIVAHNHPSGALRPSDQDLRQTAALVRSQRAIGAPLIDHMIYTRRGIYSIRENHPELFTDANPNLV